MGKFSNTWALMGDSWNVLKQNKELLLFPLLSALCCLLVIASFAIPIMGSDAWQDFSEDSSAEAAASETAPSEQITYYVTLFVFYFHGIEGTPV